jgi:hypothetical protein
MSVEYIDIDSNKIDIDSKNTQSTIVPHIKNRAILAFAYKLIDHFPKVTLFGSIVREIIAPSFIEGIYPFSNTFNTQYDLTDIDIIYTLDTNSEQKISNLNLMRYELENMHHKIREWDWWLDHYEKIKVYGVKGLRYHVKNLILDFSIHIDFIIQDSKYIVDFDVNTMRFNKKRGLFLSLEDTDNTIKSIFNIDYTFQNLLKCIKNRECKSVYGLHKTQGFGQDAEYIGKNVLSIKRYVKMLKNNWTILNQTKTIKVHDHTNNDHLCNICFEVPTDIHIELICSKCILCLDCFESLMKNMDFSTCTFKCPTCKKAICPFANSL